jgi:hypothetical protein
MRVRLLPLVPFPYLARADRASPSTTAGGDGTYNLEGSGPLVYCGLQGWMPALKHIMEKNDLGHALCENLRKGTWALDYVVSRLEKCVFFSSTSSTSSFSSRMEAAPTTRSATGRSERLAKPSPSPADKPMSTLLSPPPLPGSVNASTSSALTSLRSCAPSTSPSSSTLPLRPLATTPSTSFHRSFVREPPSFTNSLSPVFRCMDKSRAPVSMPRRRRRVWLLDCLTSLPGCVFLLPLVLLFSPSMLTPPFWSSFAADSGLALGVAMSSSLFAVSSSLPVNSRRRGSTSSLSPPLRSTASSPTCS